MTPNPSTSRAAPFVALLAGISLGACKTSVTPISSDGTRAAQSRAVPDANTSTPEDAAVDAGTAAAEDSATATTDTAADAMGQVTVTVSGSTTMVVTSDGGTTTQTVSNHTISTDNERCLIINATEADPQELSAAVVERTLTLEPTQVISSIAVPAQIRVDPSLTGGPEVILRANEGLNEQLTATVVDGELQLAVADGYYCGITELMIEVRIAALTEVRAEMGAKVTLSEASGDALHIVSDGGASLVAEGQVAQWQAVATDGSRIELTSDGAENISLTVQDGSSAQLKGTATSLQATLQTGSSLSAGEPDFATESAAIEATTASSGELCVHQTVAGTVDVTSHVTVQCGGTSTLADTP